MGTFLFVLQILYLYPEQQLSIGGNSITIAKGGIHMGTPLTRNIKFEDDLIEDRIARSLKVVNTIQGFGSAKLLLPPTISSKLYWSMCVTKLMHGLEIADLSESNINKLDTFHGSVAKAIQGIPKRSPNISCLAPLGWLSMEGYIDYLKLMFLWRILLLSSSCV